MHSVCLTWTSEIVTWSDVCYYCCVLDCEILTFSRKGMEKLTLWLILISVCEI